MAHIVSTKIYVEVQLLSSCSYLKFNTWQHYSSHKSPYDNRRRLCSSASAPPTVRLTRLHVTMTDRAFAVAGSRLGNSLPHHVTFASSHTPCWMQPSENICIRSRFPL